jgi:hypothetical protein
MLTRVLEKTALLDYSLITSPLPLCVSPATGAPTTATMTFVVSAPATGSVTVTRLAFTLPVGTDPTDLTEDAGPITASVSSSGHDQWQAGTGTAPGTFIVRPLTGDALEIGAQALTISFQNVPVSRVVGTARVKIVEERAAPDGRGTVSIEVPKFPLGFYALDFTATVPDVASGQTVTLKWQASANAHCEISRSGGDAPVDVSAMRTWTSPPIYATTVFLLHASATDGGQTVALDLNTTVIVAAPEVVSFDAHPDQVDYNQEVVVTWRSEGADGVDLLHGQYGREVLPKISDPTQPKKLVLRSGDTYTLQAFKKQGDSRIVSRPYPLVFIFNPVRIAFTADPEIVDLDHRSTTLKWETAQANEVRLDDKVVEKVGKKIESPTSPTTYHLKVMGEDGQTVEKTVTVTPAKIDIIADHSTLEGDTVVASFEVKNAASCDCTVSASWQLRHTPNGAETDQEIASPYMQKTSATRWEGRAYLSGRGRGGINIILLHIYWRFRGIDPADDVEPQTKLR